MTVINPQPFYVYDWYWVTQDTNPTTQVYSSVSNGYVANNAAAYLAWLSLENEGLGVDISGAANNGAGLIRLTVTQTVQMATGQRLHVTGVEGTTEANGNWAITVVDATHIDLQGSAFANVYTGSGRVRGATVIDTFANLMVIADNHARATFVQTSLVQTSGTNVTLTNPPPNRIHLTATANIDLVLPPANAFRSIPIGFPLLVQAGTSAFNITVKDNAGTSLTILSGLSFVDGEKVTNTNAAGTWTFLRVDRLAVTASATDLQTGTLAAARLPQFTGGDVTTSGVGSTNLQIGADTVGNAELANMAQNTVKLRITSGTGDPEDGTAEQAAKVINTGRPAFKANKNATDQTGITNTTATKVTFTTEVFDIGSYYDNTNSKWTPPAGKVRIHACLYTTANIVDQQQYVVFIYKNGGFLAVNYVLASGTSSLSVDIDVTDDANGSDIYECYFQGNGAGNKTIDGQTYNSWFEGFYL